MGSRNLKKMVIAAEILGICFLLALTYTYINAFLFLFEFVSEI